MSSSSEPASLDGRSARRARNSDAVLDAVHELFVEGQHVPNIEDVAARAGVSLRSVYRYFPDSRQLMLAALVRRTQLAEPSWELPEEGQGTFEERVDRFVEHRMSAVRRTRPRPSGRRSRSRTRCPRSPSRWTGAVTQVAEQARRHFAQELAEVPSRGGRVEAHAASSCSCQFESLDLLRSRQGLSRRRAHDVLVDRRPGAPEALLVHLRRGRCAESAVLS